MEKFTNNIMTKDHTLPEKTFEVYWKNGKTETFKGININAAFINAGYDLTVPPSPFRNMEYYREIK
jgi:hypothetical protein